MDDWQIVYKVIANGGGGVYTSAVVRHSPFNVYYYAESKAVPAIPDTLILAFSTLQAAQTFSVMYYEVWRAEGLNPRPVLTLYDSEDTFFDGISLAEMAEFWQSGRPFAQPDLVLNKYVHHPEFKAPEGTVGCEALILQRRIL